MENALPETFADWQATQANCERDGGIFQLFFAARRLHALCDEALERLRVVVFSEGQDLVQRGHPPQSAISMKSG